MNTKMLQKQILDRPKMYVCCMDDIFAVFDNDIYISYTIDMSKSTLQFLDVFVLTKDKGVVTWVWRKPTNTGMFVNFKAVCPQNWNSGFISCMLHRAKIICSNDTPFLKKVNQFGFLFLVNNYISSFFDKGFRKFMVKDHFLPDH